MGCRLTHTAFFEKQYMGWGARLSLSLGHVTLVGDAELELRDGHTDYLKKLKWHAFL